MRMFGIVSIFVFVVFVSFRKASGQDAIFSQFYANPLYLNPAFTGSGPCDRVIFNYRNQPFPVFGTFSSYGFSADMYSRALSGGLGINLIHDNRADLLSHTLVGGSYAWQGRLSQDWNISLGFQASYLNYRIHGENLIFPDQLVSGGLQQSNEIFDNIMSSHNVDFASGFLFYNGSFYGGAAVHHINRPSLSVFDYENLPIKYTVTMGYEYTPIGQKRGSDDYLTLSPNIVIQSQSDYLLFNYGFYAHVKKLTAGLWFRHNIQHPNTLIFTFGIKQVNYAVGYSYDYSLSGFSGAGGGAHEVGVLLNFNCRRSDMKYRILNCPTF